MKTYWLLNAAVAVADEGALYTYRPIDRDEAVDWLQENNFVACIGYPKNAEILENMSGVPVLVSPQAVDIRPGDEALVMRLNYRGQGARNKDRTVFADDFEFAIWERLS